ncbi:hypothetical protein IANJMKHF_00371 [Klebsiella phage CPRSA]|nr:hypothetical protein IANJMKHF_00371 [Klebsiella phage CPRSA]
MNVKIIDRAVITDNMYTRILVIMAVFSDTSKELILM